MPTAAGAAPTRSHGKTDYRTFPAAHNGVTSPEESLLAAVVARAIEDIQAAAKTIRSAERKHEEALANGEYRPAWGLASKARSAMTRYQVRTALLLIEDMEGLGPTIKRRLADDLTTLGNWTGV